MSTATSYKKKEVLVLTPYSFGLSPTRQQYFSLRTNQPPATSQQYFSLRTNQHQPNEHAVREIKLNHIIKKNLVKIQYDIILPYTLGKEPTRIYQSKCRHATLFHAIAHSARTKFE
jgi:hypothetical protein